MEKLERYRQYIRQILEEYSKLKLPYDDVEVQLIFDTEHDHYQMLRVGWHGYKRFHGCLLHLDIKDGKIWIQHDGTEDGVANELVELGVPKEDIVLAFHAPYKRPLTGFATA